jgi:ribose transport system permease protein
MAISKPKQHQAFFANLFERYGTVSVLVIMLLVNMIWTPNFFRIGTLRNVINQSTTIMLTGLGMTMVVATGGINISVGSVMALASMVSAKTMGFGILPCILIGLGASALCGAICGFIVAKFKIQPIIVTLVMMMAARGFAQVLNDAMILQFYSPAFSMLGTYRIFGTIPIQLIFILVALGIVLFLVTKTTFGRYMQAVGDNPMAARLSGVNIFGTIMLVYVISSVFAGFAGIVETARISAADGNSIGNLAELDAIAAVAVGGTPLSGGRAKVMGTVAGALIMQLVGMTVNMNGILSSWGMVAKALILILAVYLGSDRSKS